jgi:hypothetical protein
LRWPISVCIGCWRAGWTSGASTSRCDVKSAAALILLTFIQAQIKYPLSNKFG